MSPELPTSPFTEVTYGAIAVAYSDTYLYFRNRVTGWQGEVVGDAVDLVVCAINAQRPEVVEIRLSGLGSPLGCDVSEAAVRAFYPSLHA